MNNYKIKNIIGDGAFGVVLKGVDKRTNEVVAIKKLKKTVVSMEEGVRLREVQSLRKLEGCDQVCQLRDVQRENNNVFLVFEFFEKDLLQRITECQNGMSELIARNIMRQVLQGLSQIHENGIFHRDIKPENILLRKSCDSGMVNGINNDESECVKLGDFGLSRQISSLPPYTDYISTRWYRAPEVLLRAPDYGTAVDVWAAGAMMAEMCTGVPLFPGKNDVDQLRKINRILGKSKVSSWKYGLQLAQQKGMLEIPQNESILSSKVQKCSRVLIDLIEKMLTYDPSKRITAKEALAHPFFNENSTSDIKLKKSSTQTSLKPEMCRLYSVCESEMSFKTSRSTASFCEDMVTARNLDYDHVEGEVCGDICDYMQEIEGLFNTCMKDDMESSGDESVSCGEENTSDSCMDDIYNALDIDTLLSALPTFRSAANEDMCVDDFWRTNENDMKKGSIYNQIPIKATSYDCLAPLMFGV